MEEEILTKINDIMNLYKNNDEIKNVWLEVKGAEIVFLAQYIERLEEKELILNALLGKNTNVVVNIQNNKGE